MKLFIKKLLTISTIALCTSAYALDELKLNEGLPVTARVYKYLGSQSSHFLAQINREYNLI